MLSPGEITKGMKITVVNWNPREIPTFSLFDTQPATVTHEDTSWCGDVLEVLAVSLPYIVIRDVRSFRGHPCRIDTRQCSLMELSAEYIAALTPNDELTHRREKPTI